jgi:y4mF family transcriptional regulator
MLANTVTDTHSLGNLIRERRQALQLRQPDLALVANVGIRFIVDIENGKETCQVGKVLRLLDVLGIQMTATSAPIHSSKRDEEPELEIDDDMEFPNP